MGPKKGATSAAGNSPSPSTLVVDHGGYAIKANLTSVPEPKYIPNCVTKSKNMQNRIFVGDQLQECKDFSGLFYQYPFQRGYLVNWELEKQIWDQMLSADCLDLNIDAHSDLTLVISEPPFNFHQLREPAIEVAFEEFGFSNFFTTMRKLLSFSRFLHVLNAEFPNS